MKEITVYTRTTCAPCHALKGWLSRKGVKFNEINVDDNPEAHAEAMSLAGGLSIVPLTLVELLDGSKRVISGLNIAAIAPLV